MVWLVVEAQAPADAAGVRRCSGGLPGPGVVSDRIVRVHLNSDALSGAGGDCIARVHLKERVFWLNIRAERSGDVQGCVSLWRSSGLIWAGLRPSIDSKHWAPKAQCPI